MNPPHNHDNLFIFEAESSKNFNPPVTITNLTNPSHHITVFQTSFFFLRHFTPDVNDHTTVSQTRVFNPFCEIVVWSLKFRVENVFEKKILKSRYVRLWYGHWRIGSKTRVKKNDPVCRIVIWSLSG